MGLAAFCLLLLQVPPTGPLHRAGGDVGADELDPVSDRPEIHLCCAWDASLSDGELTFSLSGGTVETKAVLRAAVRAWDDALPWLSLAERPGLPGAVDIAIHYAGPDRAYTHGMAVTRFDRDGLARRVDITIRGKPAPANAGPLEQIMKHELGHGLGIGHAEFSHHLMSPAVDPAPQAVPECAIEAARQANAWQAVTRADRPHAPEVDIVRCDPG